MAASQPLVAADVLAAYRLDRHRCLLDLGGGDGTFLVAAAAAAPGLKLMLFDLPAVAERARRVLRTRVWPIGRPMRWRRFSHRSRCRRVPTSFRWSGSFTITMTKPRWRSCARPGRRCRRAGRCCWRSRWPARRTPSAVGAYFALLPAGDGKRPAAPHRGAVRLAAHGRVHRVRVLPTRRPMLVRVLIALPNEQTQLYYVNHS